MTTFTSVLTPGTKQASEILGSFYIMLGVAAFLFAIVAGLMAYAAIRFRRREGREPKQFNENVKLEVLWIAIPALIVSGLFVVTVWVMLEVNPSILGKKPDLTVVAHQWWWELHYSPSGVTAANEIHLPVGQKLLLRFKSADVIHTFWVPSFGQKIDVIPGHPNYLWLTIERPGIYLGRCNTFCGLGHAHMGIMVVAQSPDDFNAWLSHQQQPALSPSTDQAKKGLETFINKNCGVCHFTGFAPDLAHVGSRETLAAGTLPNTPANLATWLKDPQAIKKGVNMPNNGLTADQVQYLTAYLEGLK